jgi:hypothetical protein
LQNDLQDAFRRLAQRRIPRLQAHSAAGSACNEVATLTGDTALRRLLNPYTGADSGTAQPAIAVWAACSLLTSTLLMSTLLLAGAWWRKKL